MIQYNKNQYCKERIKKKKGVCFIPVSPKQTKIIVIRLANNTTFYMNQNEQYVFKVYACFSEQRENVFSGT